MQKSSKLELFYQIVKIDEFLKYARMCKNYARASKALPLDDLSEAVSAYYQEIAQGGHSIVENTGGWLDSLGSGILVGKDILGFFKNIDLDNS